jgi:hypothetical protein
MRYTFKAKKAGKEKRHEFMDFPSDYSGVGRATGIHSSQVRHLHLNEKQLPVGRQ